MNSLCIETLDSAIKAMEAGGTEELLPPEWVQLRALKELRELKKMIPCKVGDIIYFPDESIWYVFPITIAQIIISDLGEGKYCVQYNGCFFNGYGDAERDFEFETDDFGKTVFLTQSEAEEALKKMEKDSNAGSI